MAMRNTVLAYLIERQALEGITGAEMARRLGIGETSWSHMRCGRVRLGLRHIERAIELYPAILERLGPAEARGQAVSA